MVLTFYIGLIALAAGTLVYLFLIALILGHRRPRKFERLLFFLVLALFLFYAGGLLEVNAKIQYGVPSEATRLLYLGLTTLGGMFLPALLLQTVVAYWRPLDPKPKRQRDWKLLVGILYVVPIAELVRIIVFTRPFPEPPVSWKFFVACEGVQRLSSELLILVLLAFSYGFYAISRKLINPSDRRFFQWLTASAILVWVPIILRQGIANLRPMQGEGVLVTILVAGILPGSLLAYWALRHNFLEFGAQRNLVYALSATFLALLYLALVRRLSGWLEPVLPPEATAAILLFALIFLFEPLERAIGPALDRRFRERVGRMQKLAGELQQQARQGDLEEFKKETEQRIRQEFGLAAVRVSIPHEAVGSAVAAPGGLGHAVAIPLRKGREEIGLLEATSTGACLTGETSAALDFLAEQLPAMVELCRLIEEKLRLERELAERERLALLGQMAASISHNLRNPLSSMKTVLQVQLENPDLPVDVRHDCALVVDEIDRMSAKLSQLLRFAKPSVNGQRIGAVAIARQIAALFGRDAERRNVRLEFSQPADEISVVASEEAFSEALSNLIVNAIEAQPEGGRVRVALDRRAGHLEIFVEDEGPGISAEARAKIFQPFYTTKATGTGLGLAIVARRLAEMGGTLACESPVRNGKGTRFRITLPVTEES
jgi:two-component system sensor histidine kinase HydH